MGWDEGMRQPIAPGEWVGTKENPNTLPITI